ncbi:MAG: ATP-binding cassette domain-containing protein [Desulfobacterales bacterium]|jgi:oligopeptide/dipeptide ABC transporter ATP-binding protein
MQQTQVKNSEILQVKDLRKYFPIKRGFFQRSTGWVKAVKNVSFTISTAKTLGLVGESGCGKTTVARLILKLLQPDSGSIIFNGQDITELSDKEMKPLRKEIQIIFQDPYGSLNPRMTIGQSISEGLRIAGLRQATELRERLEHLLKIVGMSPRSIDRYPHEFSGGQRQRIGIARALSVDPSLIICDEPISALDVSIQAQIINLLKDLQDQLELSYLFISHDLNVVGYLCNYVAVMYKGEIMEYAPADELFDNPRHPYTHLLLSAVPDPDKKDSAEVQMTGDELQKMINPSEGCNFQDRCPLREAECQHGDLNLEMVSIEHFVRCWKVAK